MSKKQKKQSSIIVKIYILILFLCGVILGLSFINAGKGGRANIDAKLDNDLVTVLVANGIKQEDVIAQYVREKKYGDSVYNQYYKNIFLPDNKKIKSFELQFKTLARNFKIDISKNVEPDKSNKYVFYDKDKIYSTVIFTKIKG